MSDDPQNKSTGQQPSDINTLRRRRGTSSIALDREIQSLLGRANRDHSAAPGRDEAEALASFPQRLAHLLGHAVERSLARGHGLAWWVIGLGCGVVAYFALPQEPSLVALMVALALACTLCWRLRNGSGLFAGLMAMAFLAGMSLVCAHARLSDAPQLLAETTGDITGRIVSLQQRSQSRARVVLSDVMIEDVLPADTPRRIRVVVVANAGDLAPGDRISVLAQLGTPPEPVMPGARNLRRELYFDQIGATGFSYGRATALPQTQAGLWGRAAANLQKLRAGLATRFSSQLEGDTGAVAATLLVGMRDGLSDETYEELRRAGLAHLMAISGMHMAMVTLSALALFRLCLALNPVAAASRSVLRAMAFCALVIATGYLALSGASTATQRAFVMIAIALVAMMVARRALTIRAVAVAALLVLVLHPESLLGPSFQMSFAATFALVAGYAAFSTSSTIWSLRLKTQAMPRLIAQPLTILGGIAMTSLIAGLATAPFAAFHFSQGAPLSLLGNVLALPLVSLLIMPAGLLSMVLTPFGMEALPLTAMGWGIDGVLAIAAWVGGMDASRVAIPSIKPQALALLTLVGCLCGLLVGRARLLPLALLGLLPLLGFWQPTPTVLIERSGRMVALVSENGLETGPYLDRSIRRGSRFAYSMWQQRLAIDQPDPLPQSTWTCDPLGCIFIMPDGQSIAHVQHIAAFEEDCATASVIISELNAPSWCAAPLIVDAAELARSGAVSLVATENHPIGLGIWTSFSQRTRPWETIAAQPF